jgi:hypothetical protein
MSEHASDEQPPAKEPKVEDPKSATISPTESGNFGPIAPEELITSAQVKNGTLRLVCSSERILKVFSITGLDKVFQIFPSVDDALAAAA